MKNGYWYLLLVVVIVLTSLDFVDSACVTPIENYQVTSSLTRTGNNMFCSGTYYLNDTDTNGVINITTNNLAIECNNTIIIGKNTTGSFPWKSNSKTGINITNCTFKDFNSGSSQDTFLIHNLWTLNKVNITGGTLSLRMTTGTINIINSTLGLIDNTEGALFTWPYNNEVVTLNMTGSKLTGKGSGSGLKSLGSNITVYGGTYSNYNYNIELQYVYASSFNNMVSRDSGSYSFFTRGLKNDVISNLNTTNTTGLNLYLSLGDAVTDGNNITVKDSYFQDAVSEAININGRNTSTMKNIRIFNNTFNNNQFAINDYSCENCLIYNNTFIATANTQYHIRFGWDNNAIYNASNYNNWAGATRNTTVYQNAFVGVPIYSDFWVYSHVNNITVTNNTYSYSPSPSMQLDNNSYNTSFNLNEPNNKGYIIFSKYTYPTYINFSYIGNINYSSNGTYIINIFNQSLQAPYYDVKNMSNGVLLSSAINNYAITLSQGQNISISNYTIINYANSIVFMGDSVTAQVGISASDRTSTVLPTYLSTLANFTSITGINKGVGGSCLSNYPPCNIESPMIDRTYSDIIANNPRFIVLQGGINDAKENAVYVNYPIPLSIFKAQAESMVNNILTNATNSTLIMESLQTTNYTLLNTGQDHNANSNAMREIAIKYNQPFVEIGYIFDHNGSLTYDTVHPNALGAGLYNSSLADVIINPNNYRMNVNNWNFYTECNNATTVLNVTIYSNSMNCDFSPNADWIVVKNITGSSFNIVRADKDFNLTMTNRFIPSTNYMFTLSNGSSYTYMSSSNGTISNMLYGGIVNVTYAPTGNTALTLTNVRFANFRFLNGDFKILI